MPDEFIRNRLVSNWRELDTFEARWMPYVKEWMTAFARLSCADKEALTHTIASGDKKLIQEQHAKSIGRVRKLLEFHLEEDNIVSTARKK
jgi:transcriptional regulator of heat shock response